MFDSMLVTLHCGGWPTNANTVGDGGGESGIQPQINFLDGERERGGAEKEECKER